MVPITTADDTVSNNNYSIDVNTIDTNPQPTPKTQILGMKSATSEFTTGQNYTIIPSNDPFSVSISQNSIDFGILSSTNPVIRTSTIKLSSPPKGAVLFAIENHQLLSPNGAAIQNTTCDNGECNQDNASLWENTLTYGFGYRCDSPDAYVCDPQFSQSNYFKQYPNDSIGQLDSPLMTGNKKNSPNSAVVTYKVNISGTQKTGAYNNSITYLAIPNF